MSRWTFDNEDARLSVHCSGRNVSVGASTPAGDVGASDAYIGFQLSPDEAREMAEWLILYASEAANLRGDVVSAPSDWAREPWRCPYCGSENVEVADVRLPGGAPGQVRRSRHVEHRSRCVACAETWTTRYLFRGRQSQPQTTPSTERPS